MKDYDYAYNTFISITTFIVLDIIRAYFYENIKHNFHKRILSGYYGDILRLEGYIKNYTNDPEKSKKDKITVESFYNEGEPKPCDRERIFKVWSASTRMDPQGFSELGPVGDSDNLGGKHDSLSESSDIISLMDEGSEYSDAMKRVNRYSDENDMDEEIREFQDHELRNELSDIEDYEKAFKEETVDKKKDTYRKMDKQKYSSTEEYLDQGVQKKSESKNDTEIASNVKKDKINSVDKMTNTGEDLSQSEEKDSTSKIPKNESPLAKEKVYLSKRSHSTDKKTHAEILPDTSVETSKSDFKDSLDDSKRISNDFKCYNSYDRKMARKTAEYIKNYKQEMEKYLKEISEVSISGEDTEGPTVTKKTLELIFSREEASLIFKSITFNFREALGKEDFMQNMRQINNERKNLYRNIKDIKNLLRSFSFTLILLSVASWLTIYIVMNSIEGGIFVLTFPFFVLFILPIFKKAYDSFYFLVITHPYDTGDRIHIDNQNMIVKKISVFSTACEKWNGEKVIIPNKTMKEKAIKNIRRSSGQIWKLHLTTASLSTVDFLNLNNKLESFVLRENKRFRMVLMSINNINECNSLDVIISIKHVNNWQSGYMMWYSHTKFMKELLKLCVEYDISFKPIIQPVEIFN